MSASSLRKCSRSARLKILKKAVENQHEVRVSLYVLILLLNAQVMVLVLLLLHIQGFIFE